MNRSLLPAVVALAVTLFSAGLLAQTETGQVAGTVQDSSGAVIPDVTVTLTNENTGLTRTTQTTGTGLYTFTNLQPGLYEVRIQAPGFAPFARRLQISVGSVNTVNAQMQVGAGAQTTVEVISEEGAEVETRTPQLSTLVTSQQVTQLPTLTRNPYDLIQTTGFVSSLTQNLGSPSQNVEDGFDRGVGMSINGQRSASVNILMDGGENVDQFDATVGQSVPLDSVQEFRVTSSTFEAQYGRASGGVINVATKSGTNAFHGTVYEFNRNSALASNGYDNNARGLEKPFFNRNNFGFSLGGPIVQNKAFFFLSGEWLFIRSSSPENILVPTPEFIAAAAPETQAFFTQYGALSPDARFNRAITVGDVIAGEGATGAFAALPATMPAFNEVVIPVPRDAGGGDPQDNNRSVARIDYNISDRSLLFLRYSREEENQFPGANSFSPYDGFNTGVRLNNHNAMASFTRTFTPTLVNQTKAIFNRVNEVQPLGANPAQPTLYFVGGGSEGSIINGVRVAMPGYLPFDPGSAIPFGGPQNVYQVTNDTTWTVSSHTIRFGGQYIHTRDNRTFGAYQNSVQSLAINSLPLGLNNFLAGQLERFEGAIDPRGAFPCVTDPATGEPVVTAGCTVSLPATQPRFSRNYRYNDIAAYAQDTWRLFPRLTLTLGVRWEYFGPQHGVDPDLDSNFYYGAGNSIFEQIRTGQVFTVPNSPIGSFWEPDYNNFAPRVGFAWDMFGTGRTALRGGYGIGYERNFNNVTFNTIQNPPNYAVVALQPFVDIPGNIPVSTSNFGPLAGSGVTVPLPRSSLRHIDQNIRTAYAHFWNLSLEHEWQPGLVMSLAYSGSRGVNLYSLEDPNRVGTGNLFLGDPAEWGLTRLNQQYTILNTRGNNGFSNYNGLNVGVRTAQFGRTGLTLNANYTWSHAIDNLSSTFSDNQFFNLGLLDPFNPGVDRGNADFDVRHRAVISAVWQVGGDDFFQNRGWMEHVLGGWSVAPIFETRSGNPFSVYDCTNAITACPYIAPNGDPVSLSAGESTPIAGDPNLWSYITIPQWTSFSNPTLSAIAGGPAGSDFGPFPANMMQRNSFYGPGAWNLNLGVYKNIRITEGAEVQLRGEAFNVFNHANMYVVPVSAEASTAPGGSNLVVNTRRGVSASDIRDRRNLQLAVKLVF
ncbi:MAG: carboxypeptidase regulatory-like domain-containing protein [Candidatus Korobacteraceae bacterium]